MFLRNKIAVIHGAAGSLGGAVAKAFANAGATVFLTGRRLPLLVKIREEIIQSGGKAEAMQCDAVNESDVETCYQKVVEKVGRVDISFNLISYEDKQGTPLVDMKLDDFTRPVFKAMTTQFITATASGRWMKKQKSGVILFLSATPGGSAYPLVGGFGPACCAIEAFSRDLASELGIFGVRVMNMRSGGSPDSRVFVDAVANGGDEVKAVLKKMASDTMLKRLPLMSEIANLAVFLASDHASAITGNTVDITCGTTNALGHQQYGVAFK